MGEDVQSELDGTTVDTAASAVALFTEPSDTAVQLTVNGLTA
jgi:hypothetical protein